MDIAHPADFSPEFNRHASDLNAMHLAMAAAERGEDAFSLSEADALIFYSEPTPEERVESRRIVRSPLGWEVES